MASTAEADEARRHRADAARRVDWRTLVLLAVPAVLVLGAAWAHRWTTDDGFINVRIVDQIFDGNGPVFNAGERIEVGTSPAWILLLVIGRAVSFGLPTEWVAVVLGIAATTVAVVMAEVTAVRLYQTRPIMPFGIIAFIALPPVWDFATAGLEGGLSFLWIAMSQFTLVAAAQANRRRALVVAAATIGLGPLVRPDLLVMSVVFALFLVAATWPLSFRDLLRIGAAMLAAPGIYELFRIAYYGALVPNTAFTKEATLANWTQGKAYLWDFAGPYELWVPLLLLGVVLITACWSAGTTQRLLLAAPVVAGIVHAFFVVRGGGDHMHARLLLPAFFAVLLPVAAVPRNPRNAALLGLLLLWTVIPLWSGGPPYERVGREGIANERTAWIRDSSSHPVTIDDFRTEHRSSGLVADGDRAAKLVERGERQMLILAQGGGRYLVPLDDSVPHAAIVQAGAIGMVGVAAGTDVYVADTFSLADPIGARTRLVSPRGRPGHEKGLPFEWIFARFAKRDVLVHPAYATPSQITAARAALRCPVIRNVLERTSEPLSLSRVAANAIEAFTDHRTRFSNNPVDVAASCN